MFNLLSNHHFEKSRVTLLGQVKYKQNYRTVLKSSLELLLLLLLDAVTAVLIHPIHRSQEERVMIGTCMQKVTYACTSDISLILPEIVLLVGNNHPKKRNISSFSLYSSISILLSFVGHLKFESAFTDDESLSTCQISSTLVHLFGALCQLQLKGHFVLRFHK